MADRQDDSLPKSAILQRLPNVSAILCLQGVLPEGGGSSDSMICLEEARLWLRKSLPALHLRKFAC